jgi:hypothetical protein
MIKCDMCGYPIKGQYVYEVKLDDGKIVLSHGGHCLQKWKINRIPIQPPDWWVRQIGQTCSQCGQLIR